MYKLLGAKLIGIATFDDFSKKSKKYNTLIGFRKNRLTAIWRGKQGDREKLWIDGRDRRIEITWYGIK